MIDAFAMPAEWYKPFHEWVVDNRDFAYWSMFSDSPVLKKYSQAVIGFRTNDEAVMFKLRFSEMIVEYHFYVGPSAA